jgi:hypothetical protein
MFKARIVAEEELARAYEKTGVTEAEVRAFLATHPKYASPLHHAPHTVAGSAANLVYEVAPLIKQSAVERAVGTAKAAAATLGSALKGAPEKARAAKAFVTSPETLSRVREDAALIGDILRGKAKERFSPLLKKLAGKAYFENNAEVSHIGYNAEPIAAE